MQMRMRARRRVAYRRYHAGAARHRASSGVSRSGMSTVEQRPVTPGRAGRSERTPIVSVVIPCLNEAANIEACVRRAAAALEREGIDGEVVVADNGSTDDSAELAASAGAQVVREPRRGYGSA